ncbi:MAG TPA: protein translocase subunit SecF [Candidatus Woesebacteria bacterium]|nr:protein translocase subunit SecF [Candidatus Woesebacteria bacterium]HPR99298.1 protein translocase subunit SecF [Candidatus Woesebacteria bacterium]
MNIMKFRPLFLFISSLLILASIFSIIFWGFRLSVDFSGGSSWQVSLPSRPSPETLKTIFSKNNLELLTISTNQDKYILKFGHISAEQKEALSIELKNLDSNFSELQFETLGATLGKELLKKTIWAIILSSLSLLLFIGSRFKDISFGASAVIAMLHDALILLGSFSILGYFFGAEIDALFVTAILTTLSSSVHDTVVTFDRIRELKSLSFHLDWVELANKAVSEVIVRSINNSMTIILMLLALVILGGASTRWFAIALLIGVVSGTYSSVGVAIPLMLLTKRKKVK